MVVFHAIFFLYSYKGNKNERAPLYFTTPTDISFGFDVDVVFETLATHLIPSTGIVSLKLSKYNCP